LRDPDRFDAWLHRPTVHACLDLGRRRRRRVIEVELSAIDQPRSADPTGALADRELHRSVVVLHYYLGMPLADVASALGIPSGTARSRLHYALASMREVVLGEAATVPAPHPGGQVA
jgi:RNA polymerase sigma-70 factor (ECF subfamily)